MRLRSNLHPNQILSLKLHVESPLHKKIVNLEWLRISCKKDQRSEIHGLMYFLQGFTSFQDNDHFLGLKDSEFSHNFFLNKMRNLFRSVLRWKLLAINTSNDAQCCAIETREESNNDFSLMEGEKLTWLIFITPSIQFHPIWSSSRVKRMNFFMKPGKDDLYNE
ncbi:hypothetical protein LguiA_021396 [Lonicera macranthoides]